jgi:hypothetical protein
MNDGGERNQLGHKGPLTVKLRGRAQAPDWSRRCTISSSTGGDTTEHHGPLQRLLDVIACCALMLPVNDEVSDGKGWYDHSKIESNN